eukprot:Phypoly_transcript_15626.p1 GENE.Phypoly_transcript_15626~~Phypoly_transcript_15626.p1  ORF type:complete len:151 (+),score=10.59 Phypoly_transcript_15626:305-757(+)
MKTSIVALFLLALALDINATTNIDVYNYCDQAFDLYRTDSNGGTSYSVGHLNLGGGKITLNVDGSAFNLKAGATGKTIVEFSINSGVLDYYDVSIVNGRDYTVIVSHPNCDIAMCTDNSCKPPGAFVQSSDVATHTCPTGGTFSVYFCAQ